MYILYALNSNSLQQSKKIKLTSNEKELEFVKVKLSLNKKIIYIREAYLLKQTQLHLKPLQDKNKIFKLKNKSEFSLDHVWEFSSTCIIIIIQFLM